MIAEPLRILVIEDEPDLQRSLASLLEREGYRVEVVGDGPTAIECANRPYDLVLLDRDLPKTDGEDLCRHLRRARPRVPILMLTGAPSGDGRANGAAADDYVAKPFGADELLGRVAALRRHVRSGREPERIRIPDCDLDLEHGVAVRDRRRVHLTPREIDILRWLYEHRARAVSRAELLERVWGVPGDLQTRTVDMTISNLRRKIEAVPSKPRIVVTVKGVGYAWGKTAES